MGLFTFLPTALATSRRLALLRVLLTFLCGMVAPSYSAAEPEPSVPEAWLAPDGPVVTLLQRRGPEQPAALVELVAPPPGAAAMNAEAIRWWRQGMALWYAGWLTEAHRAFATAGAHAPQSAAVDYGLSLCLLEHEYPRARYYAEAALRPQAIHFADMQPRAVLLREYCQDGNAATAAGRARYREALRALSTAHPQDVELQALRATHLMEMVRHDRLPDAADEAEALYAGLAASAPQHPALTGRIVLALRTGRAPEALRTARSLLPALGDIPRVVRLHAAALHACGEKVPAAREFLRALRLQQQFQHRDLRPLADWPGVAEQFQNTIAALSAAGLHQEAVDLALDGITAPRHPWRNALDEADVTQRAAGGSLAQAARAGLCEALLGAQQWNLIRTVAAGPLLPPTTLPEEQARRWHALALGSSALQDTLSFARELTATHACLTEAHTRRTAALAALDDSSRQWTAPYSIDGPEYRGALLRTTPPIITCMDFCDELAAAAHLTAGNVAAARPLIARCRHLHPLRREQWEQLSKGAPLPPPPSPLTLAPQRPAWTAPDWQLPDSTGTLHRPGAPDAPYTLCIFFQGYQCDRCLYQLGQITDRRADYAALGIRIAAISSDTVEDAAKTRHPVTKEPFPVPILSDAGGATARAYGACDGLGPAPDVVHGTFLLAPDRRVLWQDVDYVPFTDTDFLLGECRRQISLAAPAPPPAHE